MRIILLLVCIIVLSPSCTKDGLEKPKYVHWTIDSVDGPGIVSVGETLPLTVFWPFTNGCDLVDKFEVNKQGFIFYIKALGYNRGGICTMDAGIKATVYHFNATLPGMYQLRFLNPDSSYLEHNVQVQ